MQPDEPPVDITDSLLRKWTGLRYTLPPVNKLASELKLAITDDMKIPITTYQFNLLLNTKLGDTVSEMEANVLFKKSSRERCHDALVAPVLTALHCDTPEPDSTEDVWHFFWDVNIAHRLRILVPNSTLRRNTSRNTGTKQFRPDVAMNVHSNCLFRAEERRTTGQNPKMDLVSKLQSWMYDPAEYVFGKHPCTS